jgi:hypothetical protein
MVYVVTVTAAPTGTAMALRSVVAESTRTQQPCESKR